MINEILLFSRYKGRKKAGIGYFCSIRKTNLISMILTVLGCGDAFASGGQLNTCFHLQHNHIQVLLDCGATSLVGMRREGVLSTEIDYIILTHFHGDHFGGVPFILLDALVNKRTKPLTIISPPGGKQRIAQLTECLYSGIFQQIASTFFIIYKEFGGDIVTEHFTLIATPVLHSPDSLPYAVRLQWDNKVVSFSGDTEWIDALLPVSDKADLFICECNYFDKEGPAHISYHQLVPQLPRLNAHKIVLTHLGESMLAQKSSLQLLCLEDGMKLEII
ncbi:MBL fold metallo-hydrolase [Xanthocytophaga flava]|uniref:MBL fold metallo-hydrolase n=1 Tax=Xanthocytophaga flava TaxID=3048013 RepID=UPI0028D357CA|nr:MBL fold metallo-hydrolase [Xanthocytophaga flavus]MDJ1466222.1 MBL fold metallo-hydrolase [Xanthocytophaga flavus]